jgi:nitroimidazol reductase NimA-like FMN-containing flavoprotein (pyridoxamine 5'-phosphate oxidase superfamily)
MKLKKSMARLIEWERVCRVATVGKAGVPHVVPVCHVLDDGKIYFATGRSGRKILNLRANPRVAVVVDLYSDAWPHLRGAMVQGTVKLIDKGPRFRKIRASLYRKYAQYAAEAAISESDSAIVEVTPTHAFAWGID